MPKNLVVFGLGYVGVVTAAALAGKGHRVRGVDVNEGKVDLVNAGRPPVMEEGLPELLAEAVDSGRLSATSDASEAMRDADLVFVCVGTPSAANGSLDFSHVESVCEQIGGELGRAGDFPVVVLRSTVLPDAIEGAVLPKLEKSAGRASGDGYGFAVNPEFLREGTSLQDFHHPRFTIVGTLEDRSADTLAELYSFLDAPFVRTDRRTASMVKYASNAFHALKVAFANEVGSISRSVGADGSDVMRIFCLDTDLNISPAYLRPGMPFGGSCLPKDVRALSYFGRSNDVELPLINAALVSNEAHTERCVQAILAHGRKRVGLFGLSFKANTDDLRESPLVTVVERLLGKGVEVAIYDGRVSLARLMGTNLEYINRHLPHVASLLRSDMQSVIDASEVLVIGNGDREFADLAARLKPGQVLIDLAGLTAAKPSA